MDTKHIRPGNTVAYIGRTPDGNIYKVQIGRIKSINYDDNGNILSAFVFYHQGATASCTKAESLFPIENDFMLDKTPFGQLCDDCINRQGYGCNECDLGCMPEGGVSCQCRNCVVGEYTTNNYEFDKESL